MAYQRLEVLTGSERRRSYTAAEKARLVEEAFRPGVVVAQAARRFGVHESLLYRWRRSSPAGSAAGLPGFVAVEITPEEVMPETPEPAPMPPEVPAALPAGPAPVVDIALSCGARVRLDGPVDPALAAAVLAVLTAPRRAS